MMGGKAIGALLAGLSAMVMPGAVGDLSGIEFVPSTRSQRSRARFPGRHKPAGTKLARKAAKGRVGVGHPK